MYCLTQGWPLVGKHGLGGVPDKRDLVVDGPAGHIDEVLGVCRWPRTDHTRPRAHGILAHLAVPLEASMGPACRPLLLSAWRALQGASKHTHDLCRSNHVANPSPSLKSLLSDDHRSGCDKAVASPGERHCIGSGGSHP